MSTAFPVSQVNPEPQAKPADGDRYVIFEYCISLIAVTFRRPSGPIRLRPGQRAWVRGLPYCLVSLVFGWWGLPWGVIYTPLTIFTNLTGGCDITSQCPPGRPPDAGPGTSSGPAPCSDAGSPGS